MGAEISEIAINMSGLRKIANENVDSINCLI